MLDAGGLLANTPAYAIDEASYSPPVVESLVLLTPNPQSPSLLQYSLLFSRSVTGVDVSDFRLRFGDASGASSSNSVTIGSVRGLGKGYVVEVNPGSELADFTLELTNNNSIRDGAGQVLEKSGVDDVAIASVPFQNPRSKGGDGSPTRFNDSTIQGVKWNDLNENGVRDAGEPGLPGWTIYVDQNANGQLNVGEPSAVTGADGSYTITGLASGRYVVSEVPQSGWEQMFPQLANYPIKRLSVTNASVQGTGSSDYPSVSGDGRFVAFESSSILTGDTSTPDIFVFDRLSNTVEKISNGLSGALANSTSSRPSISNDGRYVSFSSFANNLVASDTNGAEDVFVYDRQTQAMTRISVGPAGVQANGPSHFSEISGNGQFVTFQSEASNLTADVTGGASNIFVYEISTGITSLVSKSTAGVVGSNIALAPSISDDGTIIAFESDSTNLVSGDTNGTRDIFVRNRVAGTTQRVSQSSAGVQAGNSSFAASVSGNGRFVGFWSNWPSLVTAPTAPPNAFLYDLQNSTIETVSIGSDGAPTANSFTKPSISTDGRYVAFGTSTNISSAVKVYDVFVRDRLTASTRQIIRSDTGISSGGNSFNFAISDDGQTVAFGSDAKQLVPGDTNYSRDVFAVDARFPWVAGSHFVTLSASATVSGIDFGNTLLDGDLSGLAWQDTNRNGFFDITEPTINNRQVYLDTNSNAAFDTGEPNVFTGSSGEYTFGALVAGNYPIREVLPTAWTEFAPQLGRHSMTSGQLRQISFGFEDAVPSSWSFGDYGDYVREGFVFSTSAGGSRQWRVQGPLSSPTRTSVELEVPESSTTQYLQRLDGLPFSADALNMRTIGSTTNFDVNFVGIRADGSRVTQTLLLTATATTFTLTGFTDIVSLRWSSSVQGISVIDNVVVQTTDWEYTGLNFGSMANPATLSGKVYYDANQNGAQEASENGIFDRLIYLDTNGDLSFTAGEPSVRSSSDGSYSLVTNPGSFTLRQVQLANWHESQPGNGYALTIAPGAILPGLNFGNWADPSDIRGKKFNDLNANGIHEIGEPGLVGWTVYIDLNNNGSLDGTDLSTTTLADDPATTSVDESGNYSFLGLIPGNYSIRDVAPNGWTQTTAVSMNSSTELSRSNGYSFTPFQSNPTFDQSLSKDGRYLAFTSFLSLLPQDANSLNDIYLLDRQTNTLELVSLSNSGALGNANSFDPSISDDGRYIAFLSFASNFYSGDVSGVADIFVRDRQSGTTTLVTVGTSGNANALSIEPMLTANGRTIIFWSSATNLIANDTNASTDLFVRNLDTGVTSRINPNTATAATFDPATNGGDITADGRFVAFQSLSNGITAGDTNNVSDIFVMDRTTNTYERVSTSSSGAQSNGASEKRSISDDGRFVVFDSTATNLTSDSGVTSYNIFIKDRQTGETKLISRNYNGGAANASRRPEISGDGRWVTFETGSTTMFADSANTAGDIIIYDRINNTLERLTKGLGNGNGGPCNQPSVNAIMSRDGSTISLNSTATNLGPSGTGLFTISRTPVYSPLRVLVTAGQVIVPMEIGFYEKTGAIAGTVFVDTNENGLQDSGEAGISPQLGENSPSVRVYIDSNNNEVFDTGEPTTLTNSSGQYSFTQLMPGNFTVRSFVASQRSLYQTSPSQSVGRIFGAFRSADSTSSTGFRLGFSEFNPQNGFAIRTTVTNIETTFITGVAYDGERVLILNALNGTLYQFRPDGQLIVQSVVPSSILFGGLAHIGGLTYYFEQTNSWPILVAYDARSLQVVRRMPLTHNLDGYGPASTFPSIGLGLGESADGQSLIATTGDSPSLDPRMLRIDPETGRVTEFFTLDSQLPTDFAATGFGGEFYVSLNQATSVRVYNTNNTLVRSYSTSPNIYFGLGGAVQSDGAAKISLLPQQGTVQQSFGYRSTLGTIQGHFFEDRNNNGAQEGSEPNQVGATAYLDLNQNRKLDNGEPSTTTDSNGNYQLSNVPTGNYTVRVIPPSGLALAPTNSSLRLFASSQDTILELDPITGTTLNQFTAPAANPAAPAVAAGLAFDGRELFYVKFGVSSLFVVNPDSGLLLRTFTLPDGSYDGVAEIAGKIYVLDLVLDSILELDPLSGTLLRTLNINALNPDYLGAGTSINLVGALSESSDRTKIVAAGSSTRAFVIDPATGIIQSTFTPGFFGGAGAGGFRAASLGLNIDFYNANNQKLRSTSVPLQFMSLGMAESDERGKRVKLGRGQSITNIDMAFIDTSTPTDISLSSNSVLEKQPSGAVVGNLSAVDANLGDLHSFVLTNGSGDSDNAAFQIVGNQLRSLQPFDFTVKSTYTIRVRATDASGHIFEKPLTVSIVNVPELVNSIQFGDGTAQRSSIRQIVFDLDGAVELSSGAIALHRRERDANNQVQLQSVDSTWVTSTLANGNTRITLSFSGTYVRSGTTALVDGNYQLSIDGSKIRTPGTTAFFDGDRNGTAGGNLLIGDQETDNFFSHYGDTNGDRSVGISEFGSFRQSFGKSLGDVGYDPFLDFDGNNAVGISDFAAFRSRFGRRLNF